MKIAGWFTFGLRLPSFAWFVSIALTGCASQPLYPDLATDIAAAGLAPEQVALSIIPLSQNPRKPVLYRADALMQPASTLKIVTTSAAFAELSLGWRGETQLLVAKSDLANMATGRLQQPLIVRGLADYDLDYSTLYELLQQLQARGIHSLEGGILIDRSLFADPTAKEPFDQSPQAYYNYQPDALPLGRNMLQVRVDSRQSTATSEGSAAKVLLIPHWQALQVKSELSITDAPCKNANTDGWQWLYQPPSQQAAAIKTNVPQTTQAASLVVRGDFPRDCLFERNQAVFSQDVTLELALRTSWQHLSGTGFGALQFGKTPDNYQLLARHYSRPLPQLVHQLNKESDNGLAQLLFQRLANPSNNATDLTLAQAEQQVLLWLSQNQINTKGMQLDNGSGLSRTAQLSAEQLAAILAYNWRQPWAPEFISSLPLAGQDGTIRQRFQQTPVLNQARLKTGTLRNVTAIAGYVWDQQQRPYVFVAIVNAKNASSLGRPLINRWVTTLVQSK